VNVASAWLLFVPALLYATPRWGLVGAWACFILHLVAMSALLELRVRGSRWLHEPVLKRVPAADREGALGPAGEAPRRGEAA